LDGGSAGLEQVEPAKVKPEGVIDSMPLRRVPIPADWRSVLRFQAQMFHWLSAEAMHYRTTAPLPLSDKRLAEETVFNLGALQSSQADDAQPRCLQAHQPVSARHSLPAATAPAMAANRPGSAASSATGGGDLPVKGRGRGRQGGRGFGQGGCDARSLSPLPASGMSLSPRQAGGLRPIRSTGRLSRGAAAR
ncbi:unnamed protein product, partial [Polarella glacialis]